MPTLALVNAHKKPQHIYFADKQYEYKHPPAKAMVLQLIETDAAKTDIHTGT